MRSVEDRVDDLEGKVDQHCIEHWIEDKSDIV